MFQADGGGGRAVGDVDQELLARRGHGAALVDHDVLLQRALEVVAERAVGLRRAQVLPVRLDEHAIADREVRDLVADLDDPADGLVAGNRG